MGKHKHKAKNHGSDINAGLLTKDTNKHGVTTYGSAYGSQGNYYSKPFCNHPNQAVMTIGNASIWAGSARQLEGCLNWDFRLRLVESVFSMPRGAIVRANTGAELILPESVTDYQSCPTIDVVWDDFLAPELDQQWWIDFVNAIQTNIKGHMAIYCFGGHGRTGTTLAILGSLSGEIPTGLDPVWWVRKNYCHRAIESSAQIEYIKSVTGRVFTSTAYELPLTKSTTQNPSWDTVMTQDEIDNVMVAEGEY